MLIEQKRYARDFHIDEDWEKTIHSYLAKRKLTQEMVDAFVSQVKVDTVAKYIRLSDEDIDTGNCGKTESGSIVSQRQLLDDFIIRNRELGRCRVIEFCT